ncbi:MAG: macro domain-containing protein [Eubacterium sp.]|nr:macro domain-containing protein [Eubacterium sp.]
MAFKIVRNDITKMNTEAIVNTANEQAAVSTGCDIAVYNAAGYEELLQYRRAKIGAVSEGEVFITPGFKLPAKYIIHAVSPKYLGGNVGEEEKLRSCYRKSLLLAKAQGIRSIAFPLIATGSFGYPKEEGLRIAVDEINAFLLDNEMTIFLVVFDDRSKTLGKRIYPKLEEYIDHNYVENKSSAEYGNFRPDMGMAHAAQGMSVPQMCSPQMNAPQMSSPQMSAPQMNRKASAAKPGLLGSVFGKHKEKSTSRFYAEDVPADSFEASEEVDFESVHESRLEERMKHISDTFSQYLMYLIQDRKMENSEVYKRAIVDKKIFSKIKNNPDYHPQKLTALCLCVGARLNLDESKDLLARAGYALSPCDKTDIIFSYFIENEIYDMIELDIQLEEHGLPCIIS